MIISHATLFTPESSSVYNGSFYIILTVIAFTGSRNTQISTNSTTVFIFCRTQEPTCGHNSILCELDCGYHAHMVSIQWQNTSWFDRQFMDVIEVCSATSLLTLTEICIFSIA